jgi:hypothetical protein
MKKAFQTSNEVIQKAARVLILGRVVWGLAL